MDDTSTRTNENLDAANEIEADTPPVSVVIATRDRPEMLREAIASVRDQDYAGVIETVVVFDHVPIDETLVSADPQRPVRVIENDHTQGLAGGRNAGVAVATHQLIAFLDDDDLFLPAKISRQVRMLAANPSADAVVCGIEVVFKDGDPVQRPLELATLRFEDLLSHRYMQALFQTVLLRRAAWDIIGEDDESIPGGYGEDYEWLLRATRHSPMPVDPTPLVRIRWSGGSFFANRWATIDEALGYLLDRYPEFETQPKGHARVLGQRAIAQAALGRRSDALATARSAFRANPLERRTPLALAICARMLTGEKLMAFLNERGRGI